MTMTPIEALQNAIQECVEVDHHGELSFKAGDIFNLIKASGFTIVSTVPDEMAVDRAAQAIFAAHEIYVGYSRRHKYARAAIASYVGGE